MSRTFLLLSLLLAATELERRAQAADEAARPHAGAVAHAAHAEPDASSPLGR